MLHLQLKLKPLFIAHDSLSSNFATTIVNTLEQRTLSVTTDKAMKDEV